MNALMLEKNIMLLFYTQMRSKLSWIERLTTDQKAGCSNHPERAIIY